MVARLLFSFYTMVTLFAFGSVAQGEPCNKFDARTFSPQVLISELTRSDSEIHSVEELICKLPDSILSNYVLVSDSRSLQEGSPDAPRAIVFSDKASPRMFISFNGKPEQKGFFNIEVISETNDNRFINFTDIDFGKDRNGLVGGEIIKGPFATVSTGNLTKCLRCHGDLTNKNMPPRPLFDAIPFWPNVYDSHLKDASQIPDSQIKDFRNFINSIDKHPRYLNLIGIKSKLVRNNFSYQDAMDPLRLAISNAKLTAALADINMRRLVYLTMRTPDYKTYRYATLGALLDCSDIETFLPAAVSSRHSNFDFLNRTLSSPQFGQGEMDKFIGKLVSDSEGEKLNLSSKGREGLYDIFEDLRGSPSMITRFTADTFLRSKKWNVPPGIAKLRWLMEGRFNPVDMRQWSIDAERSNYRFTNGPDFFDPHRVDDPQSEEWARRLVEADETLQSMISEEDFGFEYNNGPIARRACSKLKSLSLNEFLRRPVVSESFQAAPKAGQLVLVQKCAGCHDNSVLGAPDISFHDSGQLMRDLSKLGLDKSEVLSVTGSGRMPKFDSLSRSELEAISNYIHGIR